jgi:F-type H+-transporting ATPase subunit beta
MEASTDEKDEQEQEKGTFEWQDPDDADSNGSEEHTTGRVEEITGVVLEAVFEDGHLPEIYNALETQVPDPESDDGGTLTLVCEVQQHLGDDRIRAVAMDATDGLSRGQDIVDTGGPISVPVGDVTLGRIFNLLGEAIDEGDEVGAE